MMIASMLTLAVLLEEAATQGNGGGYISTLAWTIIAAMGAAIAGMAYYVKRLGDQLHDCQEKRVKSLEDQLKMIRETRNGSEKNEEGGQE